MNEKNRSIHTTNTKPFGKRNKNNALLVAYQGLCNGNELID
jgi:hypothetical protein